MSLQSSVRQNHLVVVRNLRVIIGTLIIFSLSLAFWQAQRAEATAKLPASARDAAATFTVSNANDSGDGSLRKAIQDANATAGDDTITFATPFFSTPRTITLTSGELAINSSLTINGPGANLLTIAGNNASRVFNLGSGFTASLSGMTITGGNAFDGGGIRNFGTLTVTNSTVSGNTATGFGAGGGGIFNFGTLTVTNLIISGNTTNDSGGGISNGGTLTVTNSTVSGNTAALGGGGILNIGGSTLTVTNSTISGNTANGEGGRGGGIENFGNLTVTNSTISGNRVPNGDNNGGGIFSKSAVTITNSTITNNSAAGANSAGGVVRNSGTVTLRSSIIAGNVNNANQPDVVSSANPGGFTITSSGFNLIGNRGAVAFSQPGDQSGGAGNPILNPFLGPLQNNGGTTLTHAFASLASTAIDKGHSSNSNTDQRGATRPFDNQNIPNATAAGGDGSDIGAFEQRQSLVVNVLGEGNGDGICNADCSLREAIGAAAVSATEGDAIFFSPLFNTQQTITLTSGVGALTINKNLSINGPGANLLTVSGNNASRVFNINAGFTVAISGLTVTGGRAPNNESGGGISNGGTLSLSNCVVSGNTAPGIEVAGGGIYSTRTLTISDCTISGNASSGGGGILVFGGSINITRSTISGNAATFNGGGLLIRDASGSLINTTISGNMVSEAGGGLLFFSNSGVHTLQITNCTIVNNTAPANSTGGILVLTQRGGSTAAMTLRNSIIANNTASNLLTGTSGGGAATITSLGFNLTSDNSLQFINQSTDFVNTDPLLGPLQDNGGPTPTHVLRFGSRALDAGHSSGAMTDQRGLLRRFDIPTINNEPDSDGADIGAFEAQAAPVQVTPTLAINDVSKNEGNSGTTAFDFTVTLSETSVQTVTVDYLSGGGTATAGSDYAPVEGRLTFTPGQTSKTVTVQVNGDTTVEPDETFFVNLRAPTNATIADAQGMGTIVNDDQPASLIVQNTNDSGTGSLRQVIADAPAGSTVTFSPTVFNVVRTITLASEIQITKSLTINGTGANLLALSGNNVTRVVRVQGNRLNVTLNDLTITRGSVTASIGGGILSNSGLTMNSCVIANNFASTSGGGVHLQPGATGIFTACTFTSNASASGGALFVEGTGNDLMLALTNCTISGNTATATGGALMHTAASGNSLTALTNCTIANNESADGGGIFIRATGNGATPRATTRNSIFANNTNTNLRVLSENGGTATIMSLGYNLTTGAGSGLLNATGDQLNANPLLGPLANNGGPTPTHALLAGSPAQDKGQSSGSTTDQRGNPRPFDDPALQNATDGNGADIGAFEQGQQLFPVSSANYTTPLAQESIAAAFGVSLSNGVGVASAIPLPTSLNEASFIVRDSVGMERLAPLFFAAPGQVNFQIPPGTALGNATIIARRNGTPTAGATMLINAVEPGLYTANASGAGLPSALAFRLKADGSQLFESVATYNAAAQRFDPVPINLAPAGDRVFLILYGTGIRFHGGLNNVKVNIAGLTLDALFADNPGGFVGLDQINSAELPRSLIGRKETEVTVTVAGKTTNKVTVVIQ